MRKYSKKEIIDQTITYYKKNPRGTNGDGGCVYYGDAGELCAVGRCLANPKRFASAGDFIKSCWQKGEIKPQNFKFRYQGHELNFWSDLQRFHDNDNNWVENDVGNELSKTGKFYYKLLIDKWGRKFKGNK